MTTRFFTFFLLMIVFPGTLASQSAQLQADTAQARQRLDYAYSISKNSTKLDSSIQIANQCAITYKKYFGDSCIQVAKVYHYLGLFYASKGWIEEAIKFNLAALAITQKAVGYETKQVSNILLNLGYWHQGLDPQKALEYAEACLALRKRIYGPIHKEVAITYTNIAGVFWENGDATRSIDYNLKSLSILKQLPQPEDLLMANVYAGLGNTYANLGQYDKVNRYYKQALLLRIRNLRPNDPLLARTYSNWGQFYSEEGRYNFALDYQQKALQIRLDTLPADHLDVATSYNNLGLVLDKLGLTDSAVACLKRTVAIREKKLPANHQRLGSAYFNLAETYRRKGDNDLAINAYQKALPILLANTNTLGSTCVLGLKALTNLLSKGNRGDEIKELFQNYQLPQQFSWFPNSLQGKIQWLQIQAHYLNGLYEVGEIGLDSSLAPFEKIDALLSSEQYLSWPTDTRTFILNDILNSYASGADACLRAARKTGQTRYMERAFKYSEKSKTFFLYGKLKDESSKMKAGVPDSLLNRERVLHARIQLLERWIETSKSKYGGELDSMGLVWANEVIDVKEDLKAFKQTLERLYPQYYQLKYNHDIVSIDHVQDSLLSKRQTLVEYFLCDSTIMVFLVTKDSIRCIQIPKNFPLESWVYELYQSISTYRQLKEQSDKAADRAITRYTDLADSLYQKLVAPIANRLPESLLIVPDGVLNYLPFEVLLEKRPANRYYFPDFAYWGKTHVINYSYSATLLREMRTKSHREKPILPFVGFAPYYNGDTSLLAAKYRGDYSERRDLRPLLYSGEELKAIHKMMGGVPYYNTTATKAQFLEVAGQARVIHLATHARADNRMGEYAWLAFNEIKDTLDNELLYMGEIYSLALNADLVVLSACETGAGQLLRGEGIMSLARAFVYAGAKSIVTTLWSVDDSETATIMKDFYKNMKKGVPRSEALGQAKRGYLKAQKGDRAHPYFWAGIIGIGF